MSRKFCGSELVFLDLPWYFVLTNYLQTADKLLSCFHRYLTVWACLLHSFFWNVSNAPEGGGPPTFVYAIIVGQFIAFSLFGITQFTLLWMERGAALFYWGAPWSSQTASPLRFSF